ncbi:IDEAL domain-containing protein [Cohnella hashimotonis]|uniref:IDEAL domain-containing protein n=1 Tax=Cohnella hashimotonis TaxID=2826895 RepID=A0ABT6TEL3_9BACL|nr:IDEAL domain-containing protein [Cohnella hashimotonis]MDI4645262.1 IDEAL domain-containing protein [Cohnella hashimotonis]
MRFEMGEWVAGRTSQGELIQGFVNSILSMQGAAGIYVTASDRVEAIGTEIAVPVGMLRPLPQTTKYNEEQLRNLIDVSLAIRDTAWFGELTSELAGLQTSAGERSSSATDVPVAWRNRLGLIAQE